MRDWKLEISRRLADVTLAPPREAEIVEELAQHLEDRYQELLVGGATEARAYNATLAEMQDHELLVRELRRTATPPPVIPGTRRTSRIADIRQDVRYGLRMLARNPGFTVVAVLTLALSIGATTAIFSVVYGVLLRPLPYPKPQQIISVAERAADGHPMNFTDPNFDDLRASNHSLAALAEYDVNGVSTVVDSAGPSRVGVAFVSHDFFRAMGVAPVLGRGFSPDELHEGAAPVALTSYGYWRERLGAARDLSRFKLKMGEYVFSVVGVLPPGFSFPTGTDLWFPRELLEHLPSRTAHNWHVLGRVRDGATLVQARADLSVIARRLKQQFGADIDMTDVDVTPLRERLTGDVRPALLILLGAVGFLLLVGCANVANLELARAAARERELAVRAALGADRGRLVRQFLTESLLLSLAGGVLGVVAARWGVSGLIALAPPNLPRLTDVSVNLPVLFFALAVSILVASGLGVLTALRATSADPQRALAEDSGGHAVSPHSQRLGRILVASQLAITLMLLTGSGLLGRSLLRVLSIDPGFRTENILTIELELPAATLTAYSFALSPTGRAQAAGFVDKLFERLHTIPGVQEVGGSSDLPLAGDLSNGTFLLLDRQSSITMLDDFERLMHAVPTGEADYEVASEGFFTALGIPLLRGRLFDAHDTADAPHVAVIDQSLARATWPNQDPIGKKIEFGNMDGDVRLLTVVGVVGDVRDRSLERPPEPTVYVNYRQRLRPGGDFTVVMRASAPPASVLPAVRKIVRELDPDEVPRLHTFEQVFSASLETRRFNLMLIGVFAGAALLLAAVGIYGVMAYWVARRRREIGVRMALGAVPGDVLRLVLSHSSWTIAAGLVLGLAGSLALTRTMKSLLFDVSAADPVTFAGVALLLAGVALLACYIPARRAMKVDPMVALRYE
ncbi:MAG TPA: ABC transporter permease [Terriglobia bacterium]|nr:ABC transporter permease [Terriglobia bacterium]